MAVKVAGVGMSMWVGEKKKFSLHSLDKKMEGKKRKKKSNVYT